ncbi:phospholipase D/nuclease [Mollisia scopiformis]|uniref:Phospholipase D/nuclease n=1 Tax=Mollisia scopiformis TaxID=149040 RepID=A0A194X1K8_MOLSC|nr:phospholipase D/nuclease [Mollisia scopiformis]KUJ14080.1 phospholipase D/nuclease [Mollisia scopiformis]
MARWEEEEEERELQEAIQLSLMQDDDLEPSVIFDDTLKEVDSRIKRKAEDELSAQSAKRAHPAFSATSLPISTPLGQPSRHLTLRTSTSSDRSSTEIPKRSAMPPSLTSPTRVSSASSGVSITYPNGAIRITRTPGRQKSKNCVNLEDVIHKEHLVSACVFSFFISDREFHTHFPLSNVSDAIPIYIGRDPNQDPMVYESCIQAGISIKGKLSKNQLQNIQSDLSQLSKNVYGNNYHAFYRLSPGSSHSKILVLVYPDFLRLVITSCNMMNIDTVGGDNHWYIHDMPKLSSRATSNIPSFETDLIAHLEALNTPDDFLDSIRGKFDYSSVKVHLVTSIPGIKSGINAEKHGLLRLRRVVQDLNLKLPEKAKEKLRFEICTASIGNLSAKWLDNFNDCALGKETIKVPTEGCAVPNLKLFYPSIGDVKKADESAQHAASNIGCHTRPWDNAKAPPYYIYVGSANLSQSAWGSLIQDNRGNEATCDMKLDKITNYECGVVIPGELIESLLEPGTESWQDGIVPYVQTGDKYNLHEDRPWNDPTWVGK